MVESLLLLLRTNERKNNLLNSFYEGIVEEERNALQLFDAFTKVSTNHVGTSTMLTGIQIVSKYMVQNSSRLLRREICASWLACSHSTGLIRRFWTLQSKKIASFLLTMQASKQVPSQFAFPACP